MPPASPLSAHPFEQNFHSDTSTASPAGKPLSSNEKRTAPFSSETTAVHRINESSPSPTSQATPAMATTKSRPAYSSKGTRPLVSSSPHPHVTDSTEHQSLEEWSWRKLLHPTSLRARLTVHILVLSIMSLLVVGLLLLITGLHQVQKSESENIASLHKDIHRYAEDVTAADAVKPLSESKHILYGFIAAQPPIPESSLLGFINGRLSMHQATKNMPAYNDKQLIDAIRTTYTTDHALQFYVTTDETTYTVATIPLSVKGSAPGYLAIVFDHQANTEPTWNMIRIFTGVSLLVIALIALITLQASRRVLRPLTDLQNLTASVVTEEDLTKRLPVQGDAQLQHVAQSFNGMIDRLQHAFEIQHNLLNDAGHELRTPLTVVRGHLELMNPHNATEVKHTRSLALEELSRMHRMTEDLMTVATMNRPDFIQPSLVDVGDLTVDVYQHACQLSKHNWKLAHVASVVLTADYQRLVQAFLQVCQNASKFSPEDSTIEIGSHVDKVAQVINEQGTPFTTPHLSPSAKKITPAHIADHYVYLWVRDHGVGIDPIDQERIFERFARVDHARPGSGLGLSIVDAIAQAHDGWLEVQSVPDVGSVFAIAIPLDEEMSLEGEVI
ncbi:MAG: HAMP domain-containing sensor histidine kinase [Actinomycetaceae bacterium]|nr:HAMP domain-containing sensor histidine kinase [Actinomycetaceae bacterium]